MSQAPTSAQRVMASWMPSGDGIVDVVGGEKLYIFPVFVQKPKGSLHWRKRDQVWQLQSQRSYSFQSVSNAIPSPKSFLVDFFSSQGAGYSSSTFSVRVAENLFIHWTR